MLKRTITAIIAAVFILIPILVLSDTWVFPCAVGIFSLIAIYEVAGCVGMKKIFRFSIPTYIFTALIAVFSALYYKHLLAVEVLLPIMFALGCVYLFYMFAITMFSCGTHKFSKTAELICMTLYVIIGFISVMMLRDIGPNFFAGKADGSSLGFPVNTGKYAYLLIFIGAWATDTGAYFVGVLFGKHKLIPAVSPKKTVEGALGGILGCVLGFFIYGLILDKIFYVDVNYLPLLVLAVPVAIVSQIGDLIASYLKRENGIKDFGFVFPGHGGVMDRFDSIIAVAPVIYATFLMIADYVWFFH